MRNREAVLDWLARIRVAGMDPMAVAMELSMRRIRSHAERLTEAGLVQRTPMRDGGGAVVVITPKGVRVAGYRANSRTATRSDGGMLHGRGVSWIAAHCERAGRPWSGPAELRANGWPMKLPPKVGPGALTHLPDLDFLLGPDERWAGEFERMSKSDDRPRGHRSLSQGDVERRSSGPGGENARPDH